MELKDERIYAEWLRWTTTIGVVLLGACFIAYVSGVFPAYVPASRLPQLWQLPVSRYLELTGAPTGWRWLAHLRSGDFIALGAITLLAIATPICYIRLLVTLAARRRVVFAMMAALQLLVFAVAAALAFLY